MRVNKFDYIERKSPIIGKPTKAKGKWRDWFLVKYHGESYTGLINVRSITVPERFVGKRIRIKIELVD